MSAEEEVLARCRVVGSSGCHRYDYWNEQSLFDGHADTGWCSPSRSRPTTEYLLIEPNDPRPIIALAMLSRTIREEAGFPRTVEVLVPTDPDGGTKPVWCPVHTASDLAPAAGCWVRIDLPPTAAPLLLLRLRGAALRPDRKQFTQLMCIRLLVRRTS